MQRSTARQFGVLLAGATAVGGAVLLRANAPAALHLPPCPFHLVTGFYCPGCGATRALHHLLNGEFMAAVHCNLLLVAALPFLTGFFLMEALKVFHLWRLPDPRLSLRATNLLIVGVLAWWIVRNLPFAIFAIPAQ